MTLLNWFALAAVCLLGAMSPGPSLAVVLSNTLRRGPVAGYIAALSHAAAVALYGLVTVAGLAAVVTALPVLYTALQLAGSAYLVWLGLNAWRGAGDPMSTHQEQRTGRVRRGALADGFLVAFLNPKLAVFMLALFSQFFSPDTRWLERGVMVATVGALDALWFLAVVGLVSRERVLQRLRRLGPLLDRTFGVILLVLGLSVLVSAMWRGVA